MLPDTLPALHRLQADRLGPLVALRHKRHGLYHDVSWNELHVQVAACAAALVQHGVQPGDRVGLLAENRAEWVVADMGILSAGAVNVPMHAPLSARQIHYQLNDADVRWLFVSTLAQLDKIRQIRGELPMLEGVVLFDDVAASLLSQYSGRGGEGSTHSERLPQPSPPLPADRERGELLSWRGFLQRGRSAHVKDPVPRKPSDLATIIYTSGTSGNPKGVMLTHDNLLSNARAFTQMSLLAPDAIYFNWLPFSHIYARTVDIYGPLVSGVTLCLAESAETVTANLMELQPTNMSGVPRFYEKVLAAVQDSDPTVVAKRLRAIFGPRMDWLGSGGAPLPLAVAQAYRQAGLLLLQGYGLTESSPVISFNRKDAHDIASVGRPIPGVDVRIADDGEVLTRGPHVMAGYWKNPQATAEALVDGWLHTGDLGRLDDAGFLHITGRKKDLLVLSNGKKVVPAHIEGLLLADPCIDQGVVVGDGRSFLAALIVPHWGNLTQTAGLDPTLPAETHACDPKVRNLLEARITAALRDVASYEQVKKFAILAQPFNAARDEMTVSLKLRRQVIVEHYRAELEALYRD